MNYLLLLIPIGLLVLFIWLIKSMLKQCKNDWKTLEYLQKRASVVKTKDEIKLLHAELVEKSSKIFNESVNVELRSLEGYLRGMYQQFID